MTLKPYIFPAYFLSLNPWPFADLIISLLHEFISFLHGFPVSSLEQPPAPHILPASSSSTVFLAQAKVIVLKYVLILQTFYGLELFSETGWKQKIKKKQ